MGLLGRRAPDVGRRFFDFGKPAEPKREKINFLGFEFEAGTQKVAKKTRAGASFKAQAVGFGIGGFLAAFLFGYPMVYGFSPEFLAGVLLGGPIVIALNTWVLIANDAFEERNLVTLIDEKFFPDEPVWRPFEKRQY